jgi:hypothetical protein
MKLVAFVLLVAAIVVAIVLVSGFVVMLLGNILLSHYGIKTLGYQEGIALALLLGMVGGGARAVNSPQKS